MPSWKWQPERIIDYDKEPITQIKHKIQSIKSSIDQPPETQKTDFLLGGSKHQRTIIS